MPAFKGSKETEQVEEKKTNKNKPQTTASIKLTQTQHVTLFHCACPFLVCSKDNRTTGE